MALLLLALPGAAYIYNGQELGLPNVDDLPDAVLQDPIWERTGHTVRGRDGCRVPLPWSGARPPFGFSTAASSVAAAARGVGGLDRRGAGVRPGVDALPLPRRPASAPRAPGAGAGRAALGVLSGRGS